MPSIMATNGISLEETNLADAPQSNGVVLKPALDESIVKPISKDTAEAKNATENEKAPPLPSNAHHQFPLKVLMHRLVQESYSRLSELVETLQDGDEVSRKRRMMSYINETRQQYIRLLVLIQWARRGEEVGQMIDLFNWQVQQLVHYQSTNVTLLQIRSGTTRAKIPNPDLKTALQVLTTGKATPNAVTKYYIPPKPLSAADILGILQNLNTLLSIRFALHDIPPQYFNSYTIHSGRATFAVPEEFSLDMSIANEDPASQLFVIDFRFLFTPTPTTLTNRLRADLEARGIEILKHWGLPGIYNFLHDFVLTHKISILRQQVVDMIRGRWSDTLAMTVIKRTLVIQYWVGRAGPKSWIEFAISKGNLEKNMPSKLCIRWVREAKEVKDAGIPFDNGNLSAERLLKSVISLHTAYILTTIRSQLSTLPIFQLNMLHLHIHKDDTDLSFLDMQLTPSRTLTMIIEPITGRFGLKQPSPMVQRGERSLNEMADVLARAHETIMRIRFMTMQEEIETRAKSMGWDVLKMLSPKVTDLKRWFGSAMMYLMYLRKKQWADDWIIVISLGVTGDFWWIAEINEATKGWSIPDAQKIPITGPQNVTYQFLENLEKMVASFITLYTNTRRLSAKNVNYKFLPTNNANAPVIVPTLNIEFSSLTQSDWGTNALRFSLHDLDKKGNITILVEGKMKNPMTRLQSTNLSATNTDVAFHPRSGTFILRFNVPVGSVVTDAIVERLHRIERLITFINIVQKYKLLARHVTLGKIGFIYSRNPELTADVTFSGEQEMQLTFDARTTNPHRRVSRFLDTLLNERGLEAVVWNLRLTLPLLTAIDQIEEMTPESDLIVIARSSEWYRLEYLNKNVVIDIKLRMRRTEPWWFVKDTSQKVWTTSEEGIGDGVEGLKTGTAATMDKVGNVVKSMHDLIMGLGAGVEEVAVSVDLTM